MPGADPTGPGKNGPVVHLVDPDLISIVSRPSLPARQAAAQPEPHRARATSPSFATVSASDNSFDVGARSNPNVRYLMSGPVAALESSIHATTSPVEIAMISGPYCENFVVLLACAGARVGGLEHRTC